MPQGRKRGRGSSCFISGVSFHSDEPLHHHPPVRNSATALPTHELSDEINDPLRTWGKNIDAVEDGVVLVVSFFNKPLQLTVISVELEAHT
jgi:hypothetical protein